MARWSMLAGEIMAADRGTVGRPTTITPIRSPDRARSWDGVAGDRATAANGLDLDTYAIARCAASEVSGPALAWLAVAEACWLEASAAKLSPADLLTRRTSAAYAYTRGRWGEQRGRFASTRHDPTGRHFAAARLAKGAGLVAGARRWLGLKTMDGGRQGGARLTYDAHGIVDKWSLDGWRWIGPLPTIDTYRTLALLRQERGRVDNADLHAVIEHGRAGRPTVGVDSPDRATAAVATHGAPAWALPAAAIAAIALKKGLP